MDNQIRKLRTEARRIPANKRGYRQYPREFRARVLALVSSDSRRGAYGEVARQLGINEHTVWGWREQARLTKKPKMLPIATVDDAPPSRQPSEGLAIVTASGVRIEGLSVASAVEVARALS